MADYRVDIDVNVDDSKLDALESRIKSLNKDNVIKAKVELDDSALKASFKNNNKKNTTVKVMADSSDFNRVFASIQTGLKSASKAGKIKLDFDDNGAIKGINDIYKTISGNGKDLKLTVKGVDLDGNAFTAVKNLKDDVSEPVEIKINYKELEQTKTEFQQVQANYKELISTIKEIGSIRVQLQGLDEGSRQAEKLTADLARLKEKAQNIFDSNSFNASQMTGIDNMTGKIDSDLENVKNKIADARAEAAKGIELKVNSGDITKDFAKVSDGMHRLGDYSNEVEAEYNDLIAKSKELANSLDSGDYNKIIASNEEYIKSLDKLENKLQTVSIMKKRADEQDRSAIAQEKLRQNANTLSLQIDSWLAKNSAAEKAFGSQLRSLQVQLKSCDAVQFTNLKSQFDQIKLSAERAGQTGLNFKDRLQMQFTRLAGYFGASSVIMGGIQATREMFQNVLEVDTQLTELYRVTDLTASQYSDIYSKLTGSAQQYGAVLSDLISATADWSRAGFDPDTAAGLAEVTTIYQHIADLDYEEAFENQLTAYKGFQTQLDEQFGNDTVSAVSYVTDILNELDNNYSVTAAGVGEALKRSASAMSVAGNTIQETAGMVTGITEVTQDPEKAGNALKVVSMRLRGMKGELEELGEDVDDNVENLSKMQGQILRMTHGKVNIFDDNGEFKSTYEILQGIAEIWDTLSSTDQAELLETVAGKHRANDVAAIFQNWEHVEAATKSATEATGSAAEENEKYANSIQGHLDKLKSKWQEFSNTAADSNFLKGIVQFGTDALGVLDSVVDKFGLFPTLAATAGAALSLVGKKLVNLYRDEETNKTKFEIFGLDSKDVVQKFKKSFSGVGQIAGEAFNAINTKLGGENVFDFNKFSLPSTSFISSLDNDIVKLKEFQKLMESTRKAANGRTIDVDAVIGQSMSSASDKAKEFAKSWDGSKESLEAFTRECLESERVISGSSSSLSNVKKIISAYNNIVDDTGEKQKQLANIVSTMNPSLGNFLSGLNGASASLGKYVVQLGVAAVKTLVLQAATLALNTVLSLGIGLLINAAVEGIMHWINAASELSDKVDDITTNYENQKKTLSENKKTIDDVSDSYERLSKGVNILTNENVSLSTDEYSEYIDIVNQIADTFPTLVSGYDAQGNAILTCAGNVDKLNEAYREAAENNYNDVLKDGSSIFKDFKNNQKDIEGGNLFGDSWLWDNNEMHRDSYEALKKTLEENNGADLGKKVTKYINSNADIRDEIRKAFEDEGIKQNINESQTDFVNRAIKENPKIAKQIVSNFENEMNDAVKGMQTAAESYIGKAFLNNDYSHISDNIQSMINNIVPNLGFDYFSQFDTVEEMYSSLDKMMGSFDNLGTGEQKTFETYFDLQSKVNNGDCTVGEYISNLDEVGSVIDNLDVDEETKKALKLSLNLDDNDIKKQYDDFVGQLVDAGKTKNAAKALASSLTTTEIKAAVKLEAEGQINLKDTNLKDIRNKIQKEAEYLEAMNYTIDIDAETDGIDKLNSALAQARSGTGLTEESFEALKSRYKSLEQYDAAKLFQETANGLSLNAEAVNEYEKALANNNIEETNKKIGSLKDKYYDLTSQIQNCSDANMKAQLISEQENVRQKINDLAELATMYEGLTSSYNEWQNAENSGNNRDMYQNIYSARENIKKELDNGWIDDGTKEYFQLIWGEDKWDGAGKSIQDYRDQWAKLDETISGTSYSINDFFKTNEDGELTSEGIFNFFDAVGEKQKELGTDWIQYDENGDMKSFNFGVDGDKAIADAMGISEELVQIFLRASQDAGFVVNFDGTYTRLADMQSQADAAAAKLKEIGMTNVDFNFNTKDLSNLNSQLEEAQKILSNSEFWNQDGTFNFNVEGATEAMQVVSTLQATIDNLDNHYIGLTVEDDSFKEPLEKLQDYENKVAHLNQLKLDPKANAEDIEKLEADIQDIVQYVRDHAEDLKLEITPETTDEDIANMIESGEIEIPTTLDIQTNMSETLDDLKDIMLLNSGYLTDDQALELKVKLGIATDDEQIENEKKKAKKSAEEIVKSVEESLSGENIKLSKSSKNRVTKFFEDNEYARSFDKDEQIRTVKFVANWSDIDDGKNKYTDDQIKAVVEFVKDSDAVDEYIANPIQKQAIVDFVVENQNILDELNLDKEHKDIVIDFAANNPDFLDGLDDGEKKVAIDFVAKNPGFFDEFKGEDKKVAIDFVAKNSDLLDGLSDEDKKINVEYVVKNKDLFNDLEEDQKQIAVEYIVENKDFLDTLSTEDKKIAVDYVVKNPDIFDNLSKEDQQIAVEYVIKNKDFLEKTEFKGGTVYYDGELAKKPALLLDGQVVYNGEVVNEEDVERKDGKVYYNGELVEPPVLLFNDGKVYYNGELANPEAVTYQDGQVYYNGELVQTPQLMFQDGKVYYDGVLVQKPEISFDGEVHYSSVMTSTPDLDLVGQITYRVKTVGEALSGLFGGGGVDGTAHVNGTAFSSGTTGKAFRQGDWGTKEDGVALGGELGTELLVRNGRWYTIGENGAEFFGYKKDDIIFNADQTKELFEKGKITHGNGRGKALASGTAFSNGSGSKRPSYGSSSSSSSSSSSGSSSGSSSSSSNSSSSSDASDAAEEFEETLDWIEIAIDRIERAISRLDKTASSTYKKWSKRNTALNDQINETRSEIDLQQRAYDRYIQQANSVGLSEEYASKVRNGTIDIETITDEDLNDKISEYRQWYEAALDCKDAIDDLRESESQLYEQRFNNIATEYDGYLGLIEHEKNMLEESISQSETRGWIVSKKYYDALTKNANENINELKKERDSLVSALNTAVDSGTIDEYSESWFNMKSQINEVTEAIKESETSVLEYAKSIRELDWQIFDLIQDKITDVADEAQFLVDLMENKKLYEDNGQLTDIGMATMGQYGVKYNVYMAQANKYAKKIKELKADLAKDPYNQDIQNQIDEYTKSRRDVILNAEEAKNAIKDMVEEGIDKELSALQKLIDKYNDSLDAQKD